MTREEAKDMFRSDKDSYGCYKAVMKKIDRIYDEFERQTPAINLAGACKTCRHNVGYPNTDPCPKCSHNSLWEPQVPKDPKEINP